MNPLAPPFPASLQFLTMADSQMKELLQVLAEAVRASRLKRREVERALGLSNGSLGRWLDGSIDIRLRHLLGLAEILDVPPGDFLELGFPDLNSKARRRLADWMRPGQAPSSKQAAGDLPRTTEELKALIREVLREEDPERGRTEKSGGRKTGARRA